MTRRGKTKHKKRQPLVAFTFFLILLTFGFFSAAAFNSQFKDRLNTNSEQDNLIEQIEHAEERIDQLETSVASLLSQKDSYSTTQNFDLEKIDNLETLNNELMDEAGYKEVTSAGLLIELKDNTEAAAIAKETETATYIPEDYIVHDTTLLFLINDLRPYAEAISLNGHRVLASTSIRCVGTVIMINQTRLAPPYQITVIGDSTELMKNLKNTESYDSLLNSEVIFTVTPEDELTVPAYTALIPHNYMTTADESTEKGGE